MTGPWDVQTRAKSYDAWRETVTNDTLGRLAQIVSDWRVVGPPLDEMIEDPDDPDQFLFPTAEFTLTVLVIVRERLVIIKGID